METIQGTLFREPNAPAGTPPLILRFEEVAIKNEVASRDGPPVFDIVKQVKVVVAGMRDEGPIYEMERLRADGTVKLGDENARRRFGKPFEEWKAGQSPSMTGTPLEQWPLMDKAMVASLKATHVYTVQQLAELPDSALDQSFRRGGREWVAKAKTWLEDARTAAGDVEARATIARQQQEIDELREQMREMLKKSNTLGYDKPKRGRAVSEDVPIQVDVMEETDRRL